MTERSITDHVGLCSAQASVHTRISTAAANIAGLELVQGCKSFTGLLAISDTESPGTSLRTGEVLRKGMLGHGCEIDLPSGQAGPLT